MRKRSRVRRRSIGVLDKGFRVLVPSRMENGMLVKGMFESFKYRRKPIPLPF